LARPASGARSRTSGQRAAQQSQERSISAAQTAQHCSMRSCAQFETSNDDSSIELPTMRSNRDKLGSRVSLCSRTPKSRERFSRNCTLTAILRAFGLTWEDSEKLLSQLGYSTQVSVVVQSFPSHRSSQLKVKPATDSSISFLYLAEQSRMPFPFTQDQHTTDVLQNPSERDTSWICIGKRSRR
jgi:hypothetical protein